MLARCIGPSYVGWLAATPGSRLKVVWLLLTVVVGCFFPSCSVYTDERERAKRKREEAKLWASRRRGWALAVALA
jgi:hypothetical protein